MLKYIGQLRLYDTRGTLLDKFSRLTCGEDIPLTDTYGELLNFAETHAVEGNCWQYYVAYFIASDVNAFSLAYERKDDARGTLKAFALDDCKNLMAIFNYNLPSLPSVGNNASLLANFKSVCRKSRKPYAEIIAQFSRDLAQCRSAESFFNTVKSFYISYGTGELGLNKAFRIVGKDELPPEKTSHHSSQLLPVTCTDTKRLSDIVGYDLQKNLVVANTEAFLQGKKANNTLLYGDMGTGKSSTIKALINEYYKDGLRVIEIYKHQFAYISDIISRISSRNYKYILYLDDLSFDDFEVEYKYFKAVIDGGLEIKPDNVLIYATSNIRHIIKENYSDGNDIDSTDELHKSDTKNEKLSLVSRFGLSVYYPSPDQRLFLEIVRELAKKHGLPLDADLEKKALTWAIRNGVKSGRMAEQFIHSLL